MAEATYGVDGEGVFFTLVDRLALADRQMEIARARVTHLREYVSSNYVVAKPVNLNLLAVSDASLTRPRLVIGRPSARASHMASGVRSFPPSISRPIQQNACTDRLSHVGRHG